MKLIERWSLMRNTTQENIMEHSEQVAQIAHLLATVNNKVFGGNADVGKALTLAVFHETSEVITGDLPTPIKYYNEKINSAYKDLEHKANDKLLEMLPDELKDDYRAAMNPDKNTYEYALVKAADKISAYIKCVEETACGNKEFSLAEETIRQSIDAIELPEVKYFMDNFIAGFTLTLDELSKN